MSTAAPLAPQKAGPALPKGSQQEMADPMGWLLRRTKRAEELLAQPEVMDLADQLARHIERYAATEQVRLQDLDVSVLPAQTKSYIRIAFGAYPCTSCNATGKMADGVHYCAACDGAGHL